MVRRLGAVAMLAAGAMAVIGSPAMASTTEVRAGEPAPPCVEFFIGPHAGDAYATNNCGVPMSVQVVSPSKPSSPCWAIPPGEMYMYGIYPDGRPVLC